MGKKYSNLNVYEASLERTKFVFDNFNRVYLSFSGGKDSTVMLHITADYARKIGKRFGVLIVDLEGQYKMTIEHLDAIIEEYKDIIDVYWCCVQLSLRNAVSVYEPK